MMDPANGVCFLSVFFNVYRLAAAAAATAAAVLYAPLGERRRSRKRAG